MTTDQNILTDQPLQLKSRAREIVEPELDKPVFFLCVGTVAVVSLSMLVSASDAGEILNDIYLWIAHEVGLFYQWLVIASFIFLLWLGFSRHGSHVLGSASEVEYSTYSWVGMLFCTGIGAGLLYWSTIEWVFYLREPPLGAEVGSVEAIEWAATYGIFHWSLPAWSLYALAVVTIAYPYYKYNLPYLRLSVALVGLFGRDFPTTVGGRFIDLLFILALIGGTGTSLGLGMPMVSSVTAELLGIEQSFSLTVAISVLCVAIFGVSVFFGLSRGIKRLSDFNIGLAWFFLLWVLIFGPTMYALELGTSSLGLMFQEIIRMITWTDPIQETGFVEDWTVFYWAWWLAYAPFVGMFVTKISRGRTLRAVIFGMLGYGSLGAAAFYIIWGNTVLWMDLEGLLEIQELIKDDLAATAFPVAIGGLFGQPLPLLMFVVLSLIFIATTYDSASYSIATAATRGITQTQHPARWHRVFWAATISVLPIALVLIDELRGAQSITLIVSLPLLIVSLMMMYSLIKTLRSDTV